jgi:hypothetical protein
MVKTKILVAIAAGALICGGTAAVAESYAPKHKPVHYAHKHHGTHYAHKKPAAAEQQVAQVPGNNPMNNPKPYTAIKGPSPESINGNNPMRVPGK